MNEFMIDAELKRMWDLCPECVKNAREQSVRDGQDLYLHLARIGFAYHQHAEKWSEGHTDAARDYMEECIQTGHDPQIRHYLALCHGAIMGLYSAKVIGKQQVMYAMSHLASTAFSRGGAKP